VSLKFETKERVVLKIITSISEESPELQEIKFWSATGVVVAGERRMRDKGSLPS
jgi:hypothetical protein